MGREKTLTVMRAVAPAVVLVLMSCSGCGTSTMDLQSTPDANSAPEKPVGAEEETGPTGASMRQVFEQRSQTEPVAEGGLRWSVPPVQPEGPACLLWGHVPPSLAYRRAVAEAKQRYERERNQAGRSTDPEAPRTGAEAGLRYKRALEAARYTRENAQRFDGLPEDTTRLFKVKAIEISWNTETPQISRDDLLYGLPALYVDARQTGAGAGDPNLVYDFRVLGRIVAAPGEPCEVSQRTIQGLTKYILSRYRQGGYVGIYVYVPGSAVDDGGHLKDGVLPVRIIEGRVGSITTKWYNFQGEEKKEPKDRVLRESFVRGHSPVQAGDVIRKDQVDAYVRLLKANPDRSVSSVIAPGTDPNMIDLSYNVYEQNPWHFYAQLDNSGTDRRQWNPRFGFLNTDLTGRDDWLSAMYQVDVRSPGDNYAAFGRYEFPFLTPPLRLGLYAGISKFDISPESTGGVVNFLGKGWFTGATWRYNVMQIEDWFLDFTGSLSRETSEVDRSLGTNSNVDMGLVGLGVEVHRARLTSGSSVFFERLQNFFGDAADFETARQGADPDFVRWSAGVTHTQSLDPGRIHQIDARFRDIWSDGRLVPAKMTTFGGLYTVRGYPEDVIVADGGILASVQYRYYLTRQLGWSDDTIQETGWRKRLTRPDVSLIGFTDYGRPTIKDPMPGEFEDAPNMWGVGIGIIVEFEPNFQADVSYSWALEEIRDPSNNRLLTDEGDGQWNFNFLYRF